MLASWLVLAVLLPWPAAASGPAQELRDFVAKANTILVEGEDRDLEDILTSIVSLARPLVAVRHAAESALGSEWQARTPAEREEFSALFATLLERALVLRLAGAAKIGRGVEMSFGEESIVGDMATVHAVAIGKDGQKMPLDYRLVRRGLGWAVHDVALDGVGLVENYRAQFSRIIRDTSYAELISRLRDKTGSQAPPVVMAVAHEASLPDVVASTTVTPTASVDATASATVSSSPAKPPIVSANDATRTPRGEEKAAEPRPIMMAAAAASETTTPAPPVTVVAAPVVARTGLVLRTSESVRASEPPKKPKVARTDTYYWVQVGAFRDIQMATRMVKQLLTEDWSVGMVPGSSLTRVRVGPFVDAAEALASLEKLVLRGFRPFIRVEPLF